jgi:hypothetical protein
MREHRRDPAADLSPVLVSYGKAIEAQLNELLRRVMRTAPEAARRVKVGDATRMLPEALPLTLGQLGFALRGERALAEYLLASVKDGAWLTNEFAAIIDEFARVRNPAAHGGVVRREEVMEWRGRMLGVGGESVVGRLALVAGR